MRDALVRQAIPQNSWPKVEIRRMSLTDAVLIALSISAIAPPAAASEFFVPAMRKVSASSRIQPMSAE